MKMQKKLNKLTRNERRPSLNPSSKASWFSTFWMFVVQNCVESIELNLRRHQEWQGSVASSLCVHRKSSPCDHLDCLIEDTAEDLASNDSLCFHRGFDVLVDRIQIGRRRKDHRDTPILDDWQPKMPRTTVMVNWCPKSARTCKCCWVFRLQFVSTDSHHGNQALS